MTVFTLTRSLALLLFAIGIVQFGAGLIGSLIVLAGTVELGDDARRLMWSAATGQSLDQSSRIMALGLIFGLVSETIVRCQSYTARAHAAAPA